MRQISVSEVSVLPRTGRDKVTSTPLGFLICSPGREAHPEYEESGDVGPQGIRGNLHARRPGRSGILISKSKQIKMKTRRKIKRNLGLSLFIFHRKLRFCSIFLKFSENLNVAFWENPEAFWLKFSKIQQKFWETLQNLF